MPPEQQGWSACYLYFLLVLVPRSKCRMREQKEVGEDVELFEKRAFAGCQKQRSVVALLIRC